MGASNKGIVPSSIFPIFTKTRFGTKVVFMFQKGSLQGRHFLWKSLVLMLIIAFNTIIGTYLAAFACQLFTGYSIVDISNALSSSADLSKFANAFTQVLFTFVLSGFLFLHLNDGFEIGLFNTNFTSVFVVIALLLFVCSTPLIDALSSWNETWKLPDALKSLEFSFKQSEEQAKQMTDVFLNTSSILDLCTNLLIVALLAAFSEELIFRGVIQNLLFEANKNPFLSILCTAIIFSAIHFQFYGFLPRMMMGMFLGYLYYWSGSLWIPILAHAVNNGLAVLFTWMYHSGWINFNPDDKLDLPMYITIGSALVSVGLLYWAYQSRKNKVLWQD
jgi:uncharacterized protein